jgi:hypothetical protein
VFVLYKCLERKIEERLPSFSDMVAIHQMKTKEGEIAK